MTTAQFESPQEYCVGQTDRRLGQRGRVLDGQAVHPLRRASDDQEPPGLPAGSLPRARGHQKQSPYLSFRGSGGG